MTLNFVSRGAGAEYRITGRAFLHSRSAASGTSATGPTSRNLEVWLHTGGDDLRANSTVDVTLVPASGASQLFRNVNHGQELRRNSDRTFRLTLPSAWRASDVREVQIRFHSNKRDPLDTGDNWDLLGVRVNLGSTVVLTRQGQPLHRFSGQQPSKSLPVGR
jgi:hypothetical protein